MMKGVLFSVLSLNCVAASLVCQTNQIKLYGNLKITDNASFIVKRKLECAVACCIRFYYAGPGLCQCKQDVTESRITSEEGAFGLLTNPETVKEETTKTSKANPNETHYLICHDQELHWYQYGKSGHIAKKRMKIKILTTEVDYDHSTNTLYFMQKHADGVWFFVISIGKIGPMKALIKGHAVLRFKIDVDQHLVIWVEIDDLNATNLKENSSITILSGFSIWYLHIDKLKRHVYFAEQDAGVYVTNYNGETPRLLVALKVSCLFYDQEDRMLYIGPRAEQVVAENQKKTEYKILNIVEEDTYFAVHRGTIYHSREYFSGLYAMTMDGKYLSTIDDDYYVSIVFL